MHHLIAAQAGQIQYSMETLQLEGGVAEEGHPVAVVVMAYPVAPEEEVEIIAVEAPEEQQQQVKEI